MEHVIKPDDWKQAEDKQFYVEIPFECDPEMDTVMQFIDTASYMEEHKEDFDLLNNGESDGKVCRISADKQPKCEMRVEIKTVEEAGGRVVYDKYGNPEYLPPENNMVDFMGLLDDANVNMTDLIPQDVVDAQVVPVAEETIND